MAASPGTPGEQGDFSPPLLSPGSSPTGEDQTATSPGPSSQVDPADHDPDIRSLEGETGSGEWISVTRRSSPRKVALSPSNGHGDAAAAAKGDQSQGTPDEVASRKRASNGNDGKGSGKKGTRPRAPFSTPVGRVIQRPLGV